MAEQPDDLRVPLVEEQLAVTKRAVETDRVRVRTVVDVLDTPVEATLDVGRLDVTRVPAEREVTAVPEPFWDGDTLVIPVVEERLVVEKRLFVVEEVRVARSAHSETVRTSVPLRRTRAVVESDHIAGKN